MNNGEHGGGAPAGGNPIRRRSRRRRRETRFAALDLGTNNCRLLIAAPRGRHFRIVDAFSRIVRLGEGLSLTGRLSEVAMARTIEAVLVCAEKIRDRGVTHVRCIATQACRAAENGDAFLAAVKDETGLTFEIISTEEEARLAVLGCSELLDTTAAAGLIFDIGGGSTEISWVRPGERGRIANIESWRSMPIGVVNLAEKWGGRDIDSKRYEEIIDHVRGAINGFGDPAEMRAHFDAGEAHFLGTSGTVTSIAGIHLELPRYRRDKVDGLWLDVVEARAVSEKLRAMSYDERAAEPCIGGERADLVVCGCAILEALLREWPATRIRVADRGLREGILAELAESAGKENQRNRRRRQKNPAAR